MERHRLQTRHSQGSVRFLLVELHIQEERSELAEVLLKHITDRCVDASVYGEASVVLSMKRWFITVVGMFVASRHPLCSHSFLLACLLARV